MTTDTIEAVFGADGLAAQITWELVGVDLTASPPTLTTVTAQGTPGAGVAAMLGGKYLVRCQRPDNFTEGFYRLYDGVTGDAPVTQYVGPSEPALRSDVQITLLKDNL